MDINDPRAIQQNDLPLFVFANSSTDLISFLITLRTQGNWNHAMLCVDAGKLAWQAMSVVNAYREAPMDPYLKKGSRLEFFSLTCLNKSAVMQYAQTYVSNRLKQPWYKKAYDFIGVFGQLIGFPKIHTPGLEYCSVDVTNCLKYLVSVASAYLSEEAVNVISAIPNEINPQDLHNLMVANPTIFTLYGQYESDQGVVV